MPQDYRLTQNDDNVFVHIVAYPFRFLYLDDIAELRRVFS